MALPGLLVAIAKIGAVVGLGAGVNGGIKMKKAKKDADQCEIKKQEIEDKVEQDMKETSLNMDALGNMELRILDEFSEFQDVFEQIKNRPEFKEYHRDGISLPRLDIEVLKTISLGAGILLGGLGGVALGTAGGFAAAGATTAAVMAFGTASTGTAISTLSGVAATKATLAALGGGSLATGGGGVALGSTILGITTTGAAIMFGGIIVDFVASSMLRQTEMIKRKVKEQEEKAKQICAYLEELSITAKQYQLSISSVHNIYREHLTQLKYIVYQCGKTEWETFLPEEKIITENTVLLVNLLQKMCKVELVQKAKNEADLDTINLLGIEKSKNEARYLLEILEKEALYINVLEIKKYVRDYLSYAEYNRWIAPLTIVEKNGGIRIAAQDRLAAEYVKLHYADFFDEAVKAQSGKTEIPILYGYQ